MIKVYDYYGARFGASGAQDNSYYLSKPPKEYVVENPTLVGGKEGIIAFWIEGDLFHVAHGDDGHWWLTYVCNKRWFKDIKKAINELRQD